VDPGSFQSITFPQTNTSPQVEARHRENKCAPPRGHLDFFRGFQDLSDLDLPRADFSPLPPVCIRFALGTRIVASSRLRFPHPCSERAFGPKNPTICNDKSLSSLSLRFFVSFFLLSSTFLLEFTLLFSASFPRRRREDPSLCSSCALAPRLFLAFVSLTACPSTLDARFSPSS